MIKLYNTQSELSSALVDFFEKCKLDLSLPHKKVIPYIISNIILSESVVTNDIAKSISSNTFSSNHESNQKRIWRFLNNSNFDIYSFFNNSVKYIISNMKAIKHNKFIITMDHMITNNNFVSLVFTLKVGKQGIPIYFISDKTKYMRFNDIDFLTNKHLFSEKVVLDSINYVISLFNDFDIKITFLGDRWFANLKFLKHIHQSGHYFCIRAKANSNMKLLIYDNKEKHKIYKKLSDLKPQKHHSLYYKDIPFGDIHFKCNLSISRSKLADESWYILSNIEPNLALREYAHRFGTIETLFKNQKSNGFNLERTKTRNLRAFETLYGLVCFASLWLSILGIDYTKNYNNIKHRINIRFTKGRNRIVSLFNLGLTLFKRLYCSSINLKIKCNLQLYL